MKRFRMGDHIAIMNDGEIVQIGTPEEIVDPNPVDDYVADFVKGISRVGLVARSKPIMDPARWPRGRREKPSSGDDAELGDDHSTPSWRISTPVTVTDSR